jgi:hypothetical protein
MYTSAAGFLDIGHVRDLCDLTKHVYDEIVAANGSPAGGIATTHGRAQFLATPSRGDWVTVAQSIAYDDSMGYEIATYSIMVTPAHGSAFSPEDLVSNYLGTAVAAQAIAAGGPFDDEVTTALAATLTSLGAASRADTLAAFHKITGRWIAFTGVTSLRDPAYLRRRNFTRTPWPAGMPGDTAPPAWLLAGFGSAGVYDYENTKIRPIPKSSFAAEITSIRTDARSRYGSDYDNP